MYVSLFPSNMMSTDIKYMQMNKCMISNNTLQIIDGLCLKNDETQVQLEHVKLVINLDQDYFTYKTY